MTGDAPRLTQVDLEARARAAAILRDAGESLARVRHELLTAGERTSPPVLEAVAGWFAVIQGEVAKARALVVPGGEPYAVFVTRTGRVVTEADLDAWTAEAEAGYDPGTLTARAVQRPAAALSGAGGLTVEGTVTGRLVTNRPGFEEEDRT